MSGYNRQWAILALSLAVLPLALTPPATAQPPTIRDSAGITIVTNHAPAWGDAVWRVEAEPEVSIGMLDGPDEYLLMSPQHGAVMSDGTVVVQNSLRGMFELRYYDAAGRHITTASRWGRGPYEFHYSRVFHPMPGDSLLVVGDDGRYAVFGPRGERGREGSWNLAISSLGGYAADEDHVAFVDVVPRADHGIVAGLVRSEIEVELHHVPAGESWSMARVPGMASFNEVRGRGVRFYPVPYAARESVAAGPGRFWVAHGESPDIRGYDLQGRLVTIIRLPYTAAEVTGRGEDLYRDKLRSMTGTWSHFVAYAEDVDFPDRMPYHDGIETDREGNVWVQRYQPPFTTDDYLFDVYNPGGIWLATARVPWAAMNRCERHWYIRCDGIMDITGDYVLLEVQDELDVSYVRKHRIVRPSSR